MKESLIKNVNRVKRLRLAPLQYLLFGPEHPHAYKQCSAMRALGVIQAVRQSLLN